MPLCGGMAACSGERADAEDARCRARWATIGEKVVQTGSSRDSCDVNAAPPRSASC